MWMAGGKCLRMSRILEPSALRAERTPSPALPKVERLCL